jgi:hypothetical protein
MNENRSFPSLSRRGFLGAAAGTAVAATLVPVRSARAAVVSSAASTGPLVGSTVSSKSYGVRSYLKAARIADKIYELPLATTVQKIYMNEGAFPATPPRQMTQLAPAGCQFVVSVKPSMELTTDQQNQLAQFLAMLTAAGMQYRIVLWQESNNVFPTFDEWQAYWSYYAPVVQAAGVPCGYDAGGHNIVRAAEFIPSNPTPDELWVDFYASAYREGTRLEPFLAAAQAAGISSLGLAEWGFEAGDAKFNPVTIAWWDNFCNYLIFLANGGDLPLGAIFYGGIGHFGLVDVITSPTDPRLPGLRSVSKAVAAG